MIKTYGLFWRVDNVFWGKQRVSAALYGVSSKRKKGARVDFREQRGIYALYADYDLIYIGQVGSGNRRLLARLTRHKKDHLAQRWNRFSWFGTRWVTKKGVLSADTEGVNITSADAMDILEAVLISVAEPRLNRQGGKFKDADQYLQERDEKIDEHRSTEGNSRAPGHEESGSN